MQRVPFERAIFLSWYCATGDCDFCYMSLQKSKISEPKLAKRRLSSILAEAYLCNYFGWRVGFLSAGIGALTFPELYEITKHVYEITGQKQWMNVGTLRKKHLEKLSPYLEGVIGTVECPNMELRKSVAPSKGIPEMETMFTEARELRKGITLIIGLGETPNDYPWLNAFITKHNISKVTIYALNPHEGTKYTQSPPLETYTWWIRTLRNHFPELELVAGAWVNYTPHLGTLINAGATSLTKYPALKLFGKQESKAYERVLKEHGYLLEGTLTTLPATPITITLANQELAKDVKEKVAMYLRSIKKNLLTTATTR